MSHHVFVLLTDIEKDAFKAIGKNLAKFESGDFREFGHVFFFCDGFGDGGVFSTKRTTGISFDFDLAEGGRECAIVDQASQWRLSNASEKFDRFHRLETANNSGEHAQDTGFGSCRDRSVRGRFR